MSKTIPEGGLTRRALPRLVAGLCGALVLTACARSMPVEEPTLAAQLALQPMHEIARAIAAGEVSSQDMVQAYLERIEAIDRSGPRLQAVLTLNRDALGEAQKRDAEFASGQTIGRLHGVPILLKDNIESADNMPTTAGALVLADNISGRDAPLVAGLRAEGAIILGKTNLSQWANFRSTRSISGWSALGGQVRNPHMLDRTPCGSSSGSGAAMAASLAAATVGTETNGSVICPSSMNGIVGFKPSVGLVAQDLIIPIASTQDTAGPMTQTVRDAAILLSFMDFPDVDYELGLVPDALEGQRIGVLRFAEGGDVRVSELFDTALNTLENNGAVLVDIDAWRVEDGFWDDAFLVLQVEFKALLDVYLAGTGAETGARDLAGVIAFNEAHAGDELALFDQDILIMSQAQPGLDDPAYLDARERILTSTRENGIDALLAEHDLDVLVAPSQTPAFLVDAIHGDRFDGDTGAGWMAAIAGYPHLTVPMGAVQGLPVGLSFMAAYGRDAEILAMGHAYEQSSQMRVVPQYLANAEGVADIADAMTRPD